MPKYITQTTKEWKEGNVIQYGKTLKFTSKPMNFRLNQKIP